MNLPPASLVAAVPRAAGDTGADGKASAGDIGKHGFAKRFTGWKANAKLATRRRETDAGTASAPALYAGCFGGEGK